jgi:hypothetical protein
MWGAKLTPGQERGIAFPMTSSRTVFMSNDGFPRYLRGVPIPHYRALFEGYQPYKRSHKGRAMRLLRQISDRDKHRIQVLSYPAPTRMNLQVTAADCVIVGKEPPPTRYQRLQEGAPLARFYLLPTGPNPNLNMKGKSRLSPALDGRHAAWDNLVLISKVCFQAVREIEDAALGARTISAEGPASLGRLLRLVTKSTDKHPALAQSAFDKLGRAHEHIDELEGEITAWLRKSRRVRVETSPVFRQVCQYVTQVRRLPEGWPITIVVLLVAATMLAVLTWSVHNLGR